MSITTVLFSTDFISNNVRLIFIQEATVVSTDNMTMQIHTLPPLAQNATQRMSKLVEKVETTMTTTTTTNLRTIIEDIASAAKMLNNPKK
ncbi:unnamed protein product [Rotaria sp. Silwood2]|nr:unnamed protein product [Rotaria sp. Silwood2]CAF2948709.1 unnamed protein product [Rotaria sp. Silwood2]CAF3078865.1 unnamed protein product [Rotaria sp. Silwood2]CAF3350910.1 unnamed protein product [Rotaria sp. Silwood2]CAF4247220.1 unnamed protein product [Rotaria sp. Silwood2]